MSGVHKYPTISFRVSDWERKQIDFRITVSGMSKRDFLVRSCINNRICVVGKKEHIDRLIARLDAMQQDIQDLITAAIAGDPQVGDNMSTIKEYCLDFLEAILSMLKGADYMWKGEPNDRNQKNNE